MSSHRPYGGTYTQANNNLDIEHTPPKPKTPPAKYSHFPVGTMVGWFAGNSWDEGKVVANHRDGLIEVVSFKEEAVIFVLSKYCKRITRRGGV